jgi:outer membrane immunogenic protein
MLHPHFSVVRLGEFKMKKLAIALTALAAFAGSAFAADLPAKAPLYQAPAPVYNWTGFYLFGGFGWGIWAADTTTQDVTTGVCVLCVNQRQGGKGWYGAVGGGYDWQFGGNWVAGIFADGQFGSLQGTIQDQNPFSGGNEKLKDTWAVGGRIGYLVAPNVLSYVNGGYTGSNWSGTTLVSNFLGTPLNPNGWHTNSFNSNGWFLGGGVENSMNVFGMFGPGWFMKTEYRVAQFGQTNIAQLDNLTGLSVGDNITFKPVVQTVTTALVYRFNWSGAPVAAKY